MKRKEKLKGAIVVIFLFTITGFFVIPAVSQLIDRTQNPNNSNAGVVQ